MKPGIRCRARAFRFTETSDAQSGSPLHSRREHDDLGDGIVSACLKWIGSHHMAIGYLGHSMNYKSIFQSCTTMYMEKRSGFSSIVHSISTILTPYVNYLKIQFPRGEIPNHGSIQPSCLPCCWMCFDCTEHHRTNARIQDRLSYRCYLRRGECILYVSL